MGFEKAVEKKVASRTVLYEGKYKGMCADSASLYHRRRNGTGSAAREQLHPDIASL